MKRRILLMLFLAIGIFAFSQPQGSTCANPIPVDPVNAPLVNFAINSEAYGNDYTSAMITPSSNYLNGNDIVFQFTLAAKSYINASIAGSWTGLIFVATCPSTTTPAARLAFGGGSNGATIATFTLEAGIYFMIAGTYPPPVFTDMIINFSATPVPLDATIVTTPADLFVGWATPGLYVETKTLSLTNTGLADAVINADGFTFSGTNPADYSVSLPSGVTYPITIPFGQSKTINVNFNPAVSGNSSALLNITYTNPVVKTVPVSGLGYLPMANFSQNFDGVSPVPTGWLPNGWAKIVQSASASANVDVRTATPFSSPNQLTFASSTDLNAKLFLVSPTATNFDNSRVYFTARMGSSTHTGKLQVGYLTSRTDPATFVSAVTVSITGTWQLYSVNLGGLGITYPENAYIGIRYVPEVTNRLAVIDNFIYELVPTQPIFNANQMNFNFGITTWIYESATQLIQIYNSGIGTLTINEGDFVFGGDDPTAFSMVYPDGMTWPIALNFGQYINLNIKFSPIEGRVYNALLNITDNVSKAVNTITLTGTGYDAIINPPFLFDFVGTFPPKDWRKFIGLFGTDNPVLTTETAWHHRKFANNAALPANNSAGINIAGTARKHWIMSPPVDLGDGSQNYQLEFDLAMTAKNATTPANLGINQKFCVVVSTDGGQTWSTGNVLQWWDATTPISNTGEHIIFNLTGYTGRVMFGFYAESTVTGGDVDLFFRNAQVTDYIPLTQLPMIEDFEDDVFPPENWLTFNQDNFDPDWVATTSNNNTPGGQKSAYHDKGVEAQDGWLVTPLLQIPSQSPILLNFWSYNGDAADYGKNSVLVSTGSPDPAEGDFVEVWTTNSVSASWVENTVDLSAFTNQTIYIAFRYQGANAHEWYLDDINLFLDTSPVIQVTPASLSKSQVPDVTSIASLKVTNNGIDDLVYDIVVDYLTGASGWLSSDPANGTIQGGGFFQNLSVSFNSAGLDPGIHTANLIVNSNDPDNPSVIVPAILTVTEPTRVELTVLVNSYNYPIDISQDGQYVAIVAFGGSSNFLWSETGGLTPVTGTGVSINGVSDQGIVAGAYKDPGLLYNGSAVQVAGTWDPTTAAWTFLGMNPLAPNFFSTSYQTGYGITADGLNVVLMQYLSASIYRGARWSQAGGYVMMQPSYGYGHRPNGVNKNGNVIFGWAQTASLSRSPILYIDDNIVFIAPTLSGEAFGASPSGNFATGTAGGQGFLWSPGKGTTFFSNTLNTNVMSPTTVLNDGTIFGFTGSVPPTDRRAFVRNTDGSMSTFNEYAITRGLADAYQWIFYAISGATPDGTQFIGAGRNPQGQDVTFKIDFDVEYPDIIVDPLELTETLGPGKSSEQILTLGNDGTADVEYELVVIPVDAKNSRAVVPVPVGVEPQAGNMKLDLTRTNGGIPSNKSGSNYVMHYDGPNANAVGLTAGGEFYVAARFPSAMVNLYAGALLQSVDVYINAMPTRASLKIWDAGTTTAPGDLLHEQSFTPVATSWNTITLDVPVEILGEDIWIGYSVEHPAQTWVAGCDGGPNVPDGDWISNDGTTWEHLSNYGINANWNIRALLILPEVGWLSLNPISGVINPDVAIPVAVGFDSEGLEDGAYYAQIVVNSNDEGEPVIVIPVELLVGWAQEIEITAGWSGISSYVVPENPDIENVLADIEDQMELIFESGDGFYWPAQNINLIGNWDSYKGYKIKMNEPAMLGFDGLQVSPAVVELPAGTNFLPVLSPNGAGIEMLEALGNDLLFAYNIQEGLVYWPNGGLYTLTSLEPGVGYLIKLYNPATFDFTGKSATTKLPGSKYINNTPWNNVTKTGDAHIISVTAEALKEVLAGDVIGVFNSQGNCVGMTEIRNTIINAALVAYGDDQTTSVNDGLITGEMMTFRLFRPGSGQVAELNVTYDPSYNTGIFEAEALSMITSLKFSPLGINALQNGNFDIYPNPSTGMINIIADGSMYIEVLNAHGQVMMAEQIEGKTTVDLSSLGSGVYYIQARGTYGVSVKKVVIN